MELNLRFYGDSILRADAADVDVFDDTLAEEARAMIETMQRERGIGLAAPQVGLSKKLIVVLQMKDPDDNDAQPLALVNPEVVERSRETWEFDEGCLSIPGVLARVTRAVEATVRYQDVDGNEHEVRASGMFARVLQHEIDHLSGRLCVDYLSTAQKSLIKSQLKSIAGQNSA